MGKGCVRLTMRVGECEVKGVLHEVFHVLASGLVKNLFLISKKNARSKIMLEKFLHKY
jgi:hypothetical protein